MGYGDMGFRGIEGEDADSYVRRYNQACADSRLRQEKVMGFGSAWLGRKLDTVYFVILLLITVGLPIYFVSLAIFRFIKGFL